MSSDYSTYPALETAGLRKGYKMAVANVRRLISDARALRDAHRYRSAHLILLLALEELGSALQLYEAGRSRVQDWEGWWRRYTSHPKSLEPKPFGMARRTRDSERLTLVRNELTFVNFDKNQGAFVAPREDTDGELLELFEKEVARADDVLKGLPPYAFEQWELGEAIKQSRTREPSVLYARVEELVSQDPTINEKDLLAAVAGDLDTSPDEFIAGFAQWRNATPKARVYMGLLRRVQDRVNKRRDDEETH